jgi:hypothetical protein
VTQEAEIGRIAGQSQPGQKVSKTPFSTIRWAWWCMSIFPATWDQRYEITEVSPWQKIETLSKKQLKQKKGWGMAQVVK